MHGGTSVIRSAQPLSRPRANEPASAEQPFPAIAFSTQAWPSNISSSSSSISSISGNSGIATQQRAGFLVGSHSFAGQINCGVHRGNSAGRRSRHQLLQQGIVFVDVRLVSVPYSCNVINNHDVPGAVERLLKPRDCYEFYLIAAARTAMSGVIFLTKYRLYPVACFEAVPPVVI